MAALPSIVTISGHRRYMPLPRQYERHVTLLTVPVNRFGGSGTRAPLNDTSCNKQHLGKVFYLEIQSLNRFGSTLIPPPHSTMTANMNNVAHTHAISTDNLGNVWIVPLCPRAPTNRLPMNWLDLLVNDAHCNAYVFIQLAQQRVPNLVGVKATPTLDERYWRMLGDHHPHSHIIRRVKCSQSAACFAYNKCQQRLNEAPLTHRGTRGSDVVAYPSYHHSWDGGRRISIFDHSTRFTTAEIDTILEEHAALEAARIARGNENDNLLRDILVRECSLDKVRASKWLFDATISLHVEWPVVLNAPGVFIY